MTPWPDGMPLDAQTGKEVNSMATPSTRIIVGDALEVLKTLPDESAQICATSPPYW